MHFTWLCGMLCYVVASKQYLKSELSAKMLIMYETGMFLTYCSCYNYFVINAQPNVLLLHYD